MFTRFTGIASSDFDTISIHCIIKFYLDFFQTIKLCCQERVQALRIYTHEFLRKKQFFVTFWVWLYKKQLGSLRGIYHSPDVADMSNLFYFHFEFIWSRGMTRLPRSRLSKWNGLNKNRYKHSSLVRRKLYKCVCTNLN